MLNPENSAPPPPTPPTDPATNPPADPATAPLFTPFRLNDSITLPNRIVMAPLTRCRADRHLVPTAAMAAHYAHRAGAGLIISEATIVRADGQGYPTTPGIFTREQIAGWRGVTEAVHAQGGRMFMQLWHVGRVSHPSLLNGELPIAPSAVGLAGRVSHTDLPFETPRALELSEIPALIEAFAAGAANAISAGFDGVEIHGANGYLIDQFLHGQTNVRGDAYGTTPAKMSRFALEVVDAVCAAVGRERVGIRLSPGGYLNDIQTQPGDVPVFQHLLAELETRQIAYIHTGIFDDSTHFDALEGQAGAFLRRHYNGTLIGSGSYTPERAAHAIAESACDLMAIGRSFIANPDYVERVRAGLELVPYDKSMLTTLY